MAKTWLFAAFAGGALLWGAASAESGGLLEHELSQKAFESARLAGIPGWKRLRRQKEAEKESAREAFLKRRKAFRKRAAPARREALKKAWEKKQLLEKALAARARAEHIRRRQSPRAAKAPKTH